ncbi:DUF6281 family protein [Streptomyces sp. NBC_01511]|uniref:DUF6281 family protein n=1 Tax=Streptomyces sp. NBC_01511 TaxID=2903889 RepID=UPI0038640372
MRQFQRAVVGTLAIAALTFGTACGSENAEQSQSSGEISDSSAEGACANVLSFDGNRYAHLANIDFQVTEKAGTATREECDDSGGSDSPGEQEEQSAFRVDGVSPSVAIAVGATPATAKLFLSDKESGIPEELRDLPGGK